MDYDLMLRMAKDAYNKLKPHCERIEIAGSIRRKKKFPNDIEIVCIPKKNPDGTRSQGFIDCVNQWEKKRGEPTGKMTQRIGPGAIKLDIFTADKDNWGYIYALRTGNKDFSRYVIAEGIAASGHQAKDGYIYKDNVKISIPEEKDLFDLFDYKVYPPEKREI